MPLNKETKTNIITYTHIYIYIYIYIYCSERNDLPQSASVNTSCPQDGNWEIWPFLELQFIKLLSRLLRDKSCNIFKFWLTRTWIKRGISVAGQAWSLMDSYLIEQMNWWGKWGEKLQPDLVFKITICDATETAVKANTWIQFLEFHYKLFQHHIMMKVYISSDIIKWFSGEGDVVVWLKKVRQVTKLQQVDDGMSLLHCTWRGTHWPSRWGLRKMTKRT